MRLELLDSPLLVLVPAVLLVACAGVLALEVIAAVSRRRRLHRRRVSASERRSELDRAVLEMMIRCGGRFTRYQ